MATDVEIAQKAKLEKISVIAEKMGLTEEDYEQYGRYKLSLIHISEPTRRTERSRMPSSA